MTVHEHSSQHEYPPHNTGAGAPEGTYGPHSSRAANAADPRVDSDHDNHGATGTSTGNAFGDSTGPAPNTAGPHKYDILNKLDPSVNAKTGTTTSGYGPGVETTPGPHGNKVMNALDPRVGSTTTTGTTEQPAGSVGAPTTGAASLGGSQHTGGANNRFT